MNVNACVTQWIEQVIQKGYIANIDAHYARNAVLQLIGENDYIPEYTTQTLNLDELTDCLVSHAIANGVIAESTSQKEALYAKIMDVMTPLPSVVNARFHTTRQHNPVQATDDFYRLVCDNGYIQQKAIAKNVKFLHECEYGTLQITINLSKPEKDPKDIALALSQPKSHYPETLLTFSNEGYYGHVNHPARSNHRLVRMELNGEAFGFQYSPYAYFDEHCIVLSEEVHPMHIDETTIRQLLAVQDMLPHYTFGSNADLPIVGGSILTHHHFQGGRYVFPMEMATVRQRVTLPFEGVSAGVLNWPMSVLRLSSKDKEELVQAFNYIFERWKNYTDESVDIVSHTGTIPHNTITPIVRYKNEQYELDLVLRNNRTTPQRPDGLFHPRPEYHHIKKENIGLIEVMGVAILPSRLKEELQEVKKFLLDQPNEMAVYHEKWARTLVCQDATQVDAVIECAVGDVFKKVLEDAGVFKLDACGREAFNRFVTHLEGEKLNETA